MPIQLWSSALGGSGVTVESVANVNRKLPSQSDYHIVPNAGHWSFLAPCSPQQAQAYPRICVDAPGFDPRSLPQAPACGDDSLLQQVSRRR